MLIAIDDGVPCEGSGERTIEDGSDVDSSPKGSDAVKVVVLFTGHRKVEVVRHGPVVHLAYGKA